MAVFRQNMLIPVLGLSIIVVSSEVWVFVFLPDERQSSGGSKIA